MAEVTRVEGDMTVTGNVTVGGELKPPLARTYLAQENLAVYPVAFERFRVWDAYQTVLPGTSASDDLGLYGGTFGTGQQLIRTYDVKAAGAQTLRARVMIPLPVEYVAAETVTIRISAGMVTTVADTSCTVDIEAYRIGKTNSIGSDLCSTSATTMNSLSFANKDFTISAGTLAAGDVLDVRVSIAVNDAATGTAVIAAIGGFDLLCDIKG